MRIFVTGASGFIGANLIRKLVREKCEILALALPGDSLFRLHGTFEWISIIRGDIKRPSEIERNLKKWNPDICVHLAWYAKPGEYLYSMKNIDFLIDSVSLLKILLRTGCKHIVCAGSVAEYKPQNRCIKEDDTTEPESLYGAAKLAFYHLANSITHKENVKLSWGRIFHPYGPYEDERRLIPSSILSLKSGRHFPATSGKQVRDYIHVEDVASAFWTLIDKRADGIFNICSGVPITIQNLLELIEQLLDTKEMIQFGELPYRDWDPMMLYGCNKRLTDLGWNAEYSIEEGLKQTIRWWKENVSK